MRIRNIFTMTNVLLLILVLVAATTTAMFIKIKINNEATSSIENEIVTLNEDRDNYKKLQIDYSPETVNEQIEKDDIDLRTSFSEFKLRINKVLDEVYNQTKTEEDYNRLEKLIQGDVGEEFTEKLLELAKPTLNQSGETLNQFDSLEKLEIKFGEYDITTHEVPCIVLAKYKSPKLEATSNSGDDKNLVLYGTDAFTLSFNTETEEIDFLDYQNIVKSEGDTDE